MNGNTVFINCLVSGPGLDMQVFVNIKVVYLKSAYHTSIFALFLWINNTRGQIK